MSENVVKASKNDLRSMVEGEDFKNQIARVLPKHVTPDRFVRVVLTAMIKNPKLYECTRESIIDSLMSLSQAGLEPDGRRAHLVPYYNNKKGVYECKYIIDYKGYVEMAIKSGYVSTVHAQEVCENDIFVYNLGEVERHVIDFKKPRGKVYLYYTKFKMKDGSVKYEVMTVEEIEKIRQRSPAGECGPWKTDSGEMHKKTPTRRGSKWIPMSPEYRDVIEKDFDSFDRIELNPKANIIPPPKKQAEPPVIETTAEPVAEPEPERKPVKVQPGDTEPPADVTLATDDPDRPSFSNDIYGRLDEMIYDYCNGNTQNMKSVYKTLTTFQGSDGKDRYCLDVEQLRRWKPGSAEKAKRNLEQRMAMGTKFKFETE